METEEDVEEKAGKKLADLVAKKSRGSSSLALVRGLLRRIGDEIGEPILVNPGDTPPSYLKVSVPAPVCLPVAISPEAADKILAMF